MNDLPVAPALDADTDEVAVPRAMDEIIAPAADIFWGVGVGDAVRIQQWPQEGLLPGPWLDYTAQNEAARDRINARKPAIVIVHPLLHTL